ncbi:MAG: hypothetical protein II830_01955 [Alphaproteobacteria bacterium]|nr:hypothetical protein [Alphaproteobacteria bacterium]
MRTRENSRKKRTAEAAANEKIRKENLKAQQDKIEKKQMKFDASLKQKIDEKFRGCK